MLHLFMILRAVYRIIMLNYIQTEININIIHFNSTKSDNLSISLKDFFLQISEFSEG